MNLDLGTAVILLQDGATTGAVYVLLALALVMVFTVTRIVLIPQGQFVVFAALTVTAFEQGAVPGLVWIAAAAGVAAAVVESAACVRDGRLAALPRRLSVLLALPCLCALAVAYGVGKTSPFWVQAIAAVLLVTSLGPALYRVAFSALSEASPLVLLIAAIALDLVLLGAGLLAFGPEGSRIEGFGQGSFQFLGVQFTTQSIAVLVCSALLIGVLFAFFDRTLTGKALRATAVSKAGAQLVGISPSTAGELALSLAAFIGAISGILIGPLTTIYFDSGFILSLKGFVGAILGGLAGYALAAAGALSVGLLESFASYWASAYKEIIVFTMIVPVLMWRSLTDPHREEEQ